MGVQNSVSSTFFELDRLDGNFSLRILIVLVIIQWLMKAFMQILLKEQSSVLPLY